MEYIGNKHCTKMFTDHKDLSSWHIGYVIGDHWYRLFRVFRFSERT